jgi:PAS domain S-box-containing protein
MRVFVEKIAALRRLRAWLRSENYFYAKLLGSTGVGILSMVVLTTIFVLIALHEQKLEKVSTRTLAIMRTASRFEDNLTALETGFCQFLITGEKKYVETFAKRRVVLASQFDQLEALVASEPDQQQRITESRQKISSWFELFVLPQLAAKKIGDPLGQALLYSARTKLQALRQAERMALDQSTPAERRGTLPFEILMFAPKLRNVISDLESNQAAYLVTGDQMFLDAFNRASEKFHAFAGHLSVIRGDDRSQRAILARISGTVERWNAEIARPQIEARMKSADLASMVLNNNGTQFLDLARGAIGEFEQDEIKLYDTAIRKLLWHRILTTGGLSILCLLAAAFLATSGWYGFAAYLCQLQKIETAERETRSIIETTLDGVVTMDAQGIVKTMNPAAQKMFDVPIVTVIGSNISKIIPQRLFLHDMAALGRGKLIAVGQRKNYYPFPIELSLSEIAIDQKRHFVALIRDVSERDRSSETLKHIGLGVSASTGKEFLRSLVKGLSTALQTEFAFIIETHRDACNSLCTLIIAEQGQIRQRPEFNLEGTVCEEILKKGFCAYLQAARTQFPDDEFLAELKAESFVGTPLLDHRGNAIGVIGVADRKIMDAVQTIESTLQIFAARAGAEIARKCFEEDLEAEKERLAVTLRSIGDGFIATDVEGKVQLINNVAEKLTGWTSAEALGKPLTDVFQILNPATRRPAQNAVQRIVESGTIATTAAQAFLQKRDGGEYLVENSAATIRDRKNGKLGVVLVFRDITEKQRIEEESRKAEKLESLGVAAGGIAHDFNNLLTAILGNLSLSLLQIEPDDEIAEMLKTAKKSSQRAQELAQQLLTFATGGAPVKKAVAIGDIVESSVQSALRGSMSRCTFSRSGNLWMTEIDPAQVALVMTNLATNAAQSMSEDGKVFVECENFEKTESSPAPAGLRNGTYVKVSVRDEGMGIADEFLAKIFDPYFTTKAKGSGLGLATAYSIVRNHNGVITVDSKPGKGSTFTIYLPALAQEAAAKKPAADIAPPPGSARILVLDDEEVICALVSAALEPCGYSVTEAFSAEKAIELYRDALESGTPFDLVISDLTIPGGMGGKDAIKKLRELNPMVRAIVSSGYATDPVMSRYQEYGFCAMLAKPYEISDLCNIVHDVLADDDENLIFHDFAVPRLA